MQRFDAKQTSYTSYSASDTNGVAAYEVVMSLEQYQAFVNSGEQYVILCVNDREFVGHVTNTPGFPLNGHQFRLTFTTSN